MDVITVNIEAASVLVIKLGLLAKPILNIRSINIENITLIGIIRKNAREITITFLAIKTYL